MYGSLDVAELQRPETAPGRRDRILVVRHGQGRGRPNPYLDLVLEYAAEHEPALRSRIDVHGTGEGRASLKGVGAVWFFLADPLGSEYPACFAEARMIAEEARMLGIRILNHPDALGRTAKSEQLARWRAAGIPCANAVTARNRAELEAAFEQIRFPAILRSDLGHTQESAALCQTVEDARRHAGTVRYPAALIEFVDVRAAWKRERPGSLEARFHHKKRSMIIGGEIFNNHVFYSTQGICGITVSTFQTADRLSRRYVRALDPTFRRAISADLAYTFSPPEQAQLMARAAKVLGLDVAAIDYSTYPDGSVVLWEANPYFYLHPPKEALLWRERKILKRTWRYLAAMTRVLQGAVH